MNPGPTASLNLAIRFNKPISEEDRKRALEKAAEKIKKALEPYEKATETMESLEPWEGLQHLEISPISNFTGYGEDEVIDKSDLEAFKSWLQDQNKSAVTQREYPRLLRRSFKHIGEPITLSEIKEYLRWMRGCYSPDHYSLTLSAFKAYMRFKGYDKALDDFKFIHKGFTPKKILSKEDLQAFFHAVPSLEVKVYFLLLASSGLRPGEVKSLTLDDVDFGQRLLRPSCHSGATKHSWASFY
ncbi:MAG: hypothetical protein HXX80_02305, partial [Nitrososphaerales archaeon]|nr:hypothetical protein [Nitrososphaerales archaeon]